MSAPQRTVEVLKLSISSGNTAATAMRHYPRATSYDADVADAAHEFRGAGIEAGGRIVLGTATTADVLIQDATGKTLYNATVTSSRDIDPIPMGVIGPINVTCTNVSDSSTGTLDIYWYIKK